MTQQQILDALDNLMPEVVSTNNPEATLLKFAKTNNLYPTQLEKLGHAFNQCKTLVGLSKQANRGDSFSILNVPEMITKYSTYKPADVLTSEEKKVHKEVNKIVKEAGVKVASGGRLPMPNFVEKLVARGAEIDDNNTEEYNLVPSSSAFDAVFNKKASADEDNNMSEYEKYEIAKKAADYTEELKQELNSIKSGTEELIRIKCASIANYLRKNGPDAWKEVVEDTVQRYGVKSASAIHTIENYLEVNHIPYSVADINETQLQKSAFVRDRHNMWESVQQVQEYLTDLDNINNLNKEASYIPDFDEVFTQWKNKYQNNKLSAGELPQVYDEKLIDRIIKSEIDRLSKNEKLKADGEMIEAPKFDQDALDSYLTSPQKNYLRSQWAQYKYLVDEKKSKDDKEKAIQDKAKALQALKEKQDNLDKKVINAFKAGLIDTPKALANSVVSLVNGSKKGIQTSYNTVKNVIDNLPESTYNRDFLKSDIELSKDFNLHKLILTDPVIAEADPKEVSDIYNTISQISPRFAQNTRLMSTALKEALQYGAVPLSMLKDLSEFEKNMNKK